MVTVSIGSDQRQYGSVASIDESWLNQQLARHRANNDPPCIRVSIHASGLNMGLSNGVCPGSGGGRPFQGREIDVYGLWRELGLDSDPYPTGKLGAFFKKIRAIVS